MQNTSQFVGLAKHWTPKSFSIWEMFVQEQGIDSEKGFRDLLLTLPSLSAEPYSCRAQLIAATLLVFPNRACFFVKQLVNCSRITLVTPPHEPRLHYCVEGVFLGMNYLDDVGMCDVALEASVALLLERAIKEEFTPDLVPNNGRFSNLVARFFEKENKARLEAIGLAFENLAVWAYQEDTDYLKKKGRISLVAGSHFGSELLKELIIKSWPHVRMGPVVKVFGQELTSKHSSS